MEAPLPPPVHRRRAQVVLDRRRLLLLAAAGRREAANPHLVYTGVDVQEALEKWRLVPIEELRERQVERAALSELAGWLENAPDSATPEAIQTEVYEIGKRHNFEPLRDWFKALYEVLFGQSQGPRFGSFAVLFGCTETAALIRRALSDQHAGAA